MFRSLHMKLTLILLLLITSLMAVVGAFLTTSISSFYIDTFYEQINAVFGDDSDGYISTLRARAAEPDGASGLKEMLESRAGSLGIDYRTRNYFILDGQSGTYLDGSTDASSLPREQTANLLTARNAVSQGDSTRVGDRSDITADYMDVAIPIIGGDNAYIDLAELHVSRDCRRVGTGTELFARVAGVARCLGARKLYISAHSAVETQAFYKKLGCVPAALPDAAHVAREPFDIQLEYSLY